MEGPNRKGRPLGRWEDRVKEYVSERGVRGNVLEWARRECTDRERWRAVGHDQPRVRRFRRKRGVGAVDWLIDLWQLFIKKVAQLTYVQINVMKNCV